MVVGYKIGLKRIVCSHVFNWDCQLELHAIVKVSTERKLMVVSLFVANFYYLQFVRKNLHNNCQCSVETFSTTEIAILEILYRLRTAYKSKQNLN